MKFEQLYSLITESSNGDTELLQKINTLHRKVRASCTKLYKLHLNQDMFPRKTYTQRLRDAFQRSMDLKQEYLQFLHIHTHDILMSATATQKIKEFKDRNPHIFSNK